MKEAMDVLDVLVNKIQSHELYRWIQSSYHADSRRHYDCFVPALSFIMTFPYYNEQYLHDGSPPADAEGAFLTVLRKEINEHTEEDRTHARLFLHDARHLNLGEVWGLQRPSTLLWTLWISPRLDPARAIQSERIKEVVNPIDAWPLYRYCHVAEIERDGNLIFSAAAVQANRIEEQTGTRPLYFGRHHLQRESGQVGVGDPRTIELPAEQSAHARGIIERKSALSAALNDELLRLAVDAQSQPTAGVLLYDEQVARLAGLRERAALYWDGKLPGQAWNIRSVEAPEQQDLWATWERHRQRFANHPFAALLHSASEHDLGYFLRAATLLFAMRIGSMHTFYAHDGRVDQPAVGPGSEIIAFVRQTFSTEAESLMHDWDVLDMDRRIPWRMEELLNFWFLDEVYGRPEMQALHAFREQALQARNDPMITYWAFLSIHFMAQAFFANSKPLAKRFSEAHPELSPLLYLQGVHHLRYAEVVADWSAPSHPTSHGHLPVTAAQHQRILDMMEVFSTLGLHQFDRLVQALSTDRERFRFLED